MAKQRAILGLPPNCSVSYRPRTSSWVREGSGGCEAADTTDRCPVTCILGSSVPVASFLLLGRRCVEFFFLLPSSDLLLKKDLGAADPSHAPEATVPNKRRET